MKYRVRVSRLRYGEVEVEAPNGKAAMDAAEKAEINWFEEETTDMTAERID